MNIARQIFKEINQSGTQVHTYMHAYIPYKKGMYYYVYIRIHY